MAAAENIGSDAPTNTKVPTAIIRIGSRVDGDYNRERGYGIAVEIARSESLRSLGAIAVGEPKHKGEAYVLLTGSENLMGTVSDMALAAREAIHDRRLELGYAVTGALVSPGAPIKRPSDVWDHLSSVQVDGENPHDVTAVAEEIVWQADNEEVAKLMASVDDEYELSRFWAA
jgi:hypothetical protein